MANITIQVPNEELPRVIAALCKFGGYAADNYSTPHAKGVIINFIKMVVSNTEAEVAALPPVPPALT